MTERNEGWRTVPGHPDYEVSNLGRVRSWKRSSTPHLLTNKPHIKLGYCFVRLDGKSYGVHQVVALAFNGPRPDGLEVDHINRLRGDNRPENLRYVTRQENMIGAGGRPLTHCKEKHSLSGDNLLVISTDGERKCRTCSRKRVQDFRANREGRPTPEYLHGTPNGYINYKCRCDPCKEANSQYRRNNRLTAT